MVGGETMNQERCLQMIIGSCMGCNIQEILAKRLSKNGHIDQKQIAKEVSSEWCPPKTRILIPQKAKPKVW